MGVGISRWTGAGLTSVSTFQLVQSQGVSHGAQLSVWAEAPIRINETKSFNPRPGGGLFFAPSKLFNISPEPLRRSSPNFQYPPGHQFYILWPKNFPKAMLGCPQITSEWHHVLLFSAQKRFRGKSCQAYNFEDTEKCSRHKRCRIITATKLLSRN